MAKQCVGCGQATERRCPQCGKATCQRKVGLCGHADGICADCVEKRFADLDVYNRTGVWPK